MTNPGDERAVEVMRVAFSTCEISRGLSLRDLMVKLSTNIGVPWDEATWRHQTALMARAALLALRGIQ